MRLGFGYLVGVVRAERGWTLKEAGNRLGVSAQFLCDVEKGRRTPSAKNLPEFARILGMQFREAAWHWLCAVTDGTEIAEACAGYCKEKCCARKPLPRRGGK